MGTVAELARQVLGAGFVVEVEADAASDLVARFAAISGVNSEWLGDVVTGEGLDDIVVDKLRLNVPSTELQEWRAVVAANGALRRLSVDDPSLGAIYARFFQRQASLEEGARDAA